MPSTNLAADIENYPAAIADLIGSMLQEKRHLRPASMLEVADRLAAISAGGNGTAPKKPSRVRAALRAIFKTAES
ncbi:MAG: hypothetical protein V3W41_15300 [Planctomycetota bacterium]